MCTAEQDQRGRGTCLKSCNSTTLNLTLDEVGVGRALNRCSYYGPKSSDRTKASRSGLVCSALAPLHQEVIVARQSKPGEAQPPVPGSVPGASVVFKSSCLRKHISPTPTIYLPPLSSSSSPAFLSRVPPSSSIYNMSESIKETIKARP